MSMSRSVILVCCLAKVMASVRSFSVNGRVEVFDVEYGEGVLVFVLYG